MKMLIILWTVVFGAISSLPISSPYRLTSFWSGDELGTGSRTGSGLGEANFIPNEFGWLTYEGKLVLAGPTEELLRTGYDIRRPHRHYFRYYDEVRVRIDGLWYDGIILDSCGACMWVREDRLDLFVANKESAIDRGYKGANMIEVLKK